MAEPVRSVGRSRRALAIAALLLCPLVGVADEPAGADKAGEPNDERIEIVEDFADGMARWEPLDADRWRIVEAEAGEPRALALHTPGTQRGGVRRPGAYALLKDHAFAAFTLELQVRTLEPDRKRGRDVCLVFGRRDPTHLHYVHLSDDADGKFHNVIMTVAGDTRYTIHKPARPEARLTRDWTPVRLTVDAEGRVAVFMGDMDEPLMTARLDPAAVPGRLGLGSFNDRAAFRKVSITGDPAATPAP